MQRLEESSVRAAPADARLTLRRDADGAPLVSATFVLSRTPDPSERLSPLVTRAVLALDLQARPDGDGSAGGVARPVRGTVFELLRDGDDAGGPPEVLARTTVTGPFAHGALEALLEPPVATELLEGILGGTAPLRLSARVELAPPVAPPLRVRVELGRLWAQLNGASDESRVFDRVDLANYLPLWTSAGIVSVDDGSGAPTGEMAAVPDDGVLDAVLRATGFMLRPVDVDGGHATDGLLYRLSQASPGDQQASVSGPAASAHESGLAVGSVALTDVVAPAIASEPQRYVHLVGTTGGRLEAVLPVRSTRATRGRQARDPFQTAWAGRVVPVSSVLNPRPAVGTHLALQAQQVALAPDVTHVAPVGLVEAAVDSPPERRPGPLVDDTDAPMWLDRWDRAVGWYAPEFVLVPPAPIDDPDSSPFRFELETSGHTADAEAGLTASITVTLETRRSTATTEAWQRAPGDQLRLVDLAALSVQLAVPFRDERGTTRVEHVLADDVSTSGPLGEDGSRIVATFRLIDAWARLAYGSLSTPAFQSQPAAVLVSASFEGWRVRREPAQILGTEKRWALTPWLPSRDARARPISTAALTPSLVGSTIRPAWQIRPELVAAIDRVEYEWVRFATTESVTAFIACSTFGAHYRERKDGLWQAVGCRPALQLGETEHRTYAPMDVEAAVGTARVYRSLQTPGRFLVVPERYAVGRYEPDQGERAYRPTLLLHSTIDVDVPSNIRCVLAASLQPVLPPFVRAAIVRELAETAAPAPRLEYPFEAGVDWDLRWAAPADVDCIPTPEGFDVLCSTDVAGFLTFKGMLERGGIRGSATATLPGGLRLQSSLVLGLSSVTGPFEAGPIAIAREADDVLVENRSGQRIALLGLAVEGRRVADAETMLVPGAGARVPIGEAEGRVDAMFQPDEGMERLEEVRAYIEDLELGVVFVATSDPAEAGLVGLEIETTFMDHKDPENLVLTGERREAERSYSLPLTAFVADPVLEFTVVAVAPDGSREQGPTTTWPVRTRGALIPIGLPG